MASFLDYNFLTGLIVLTASAATAWALVLSHYSRKWAFRVITFYVFLPLIGISTGLQIRKSNLDTRQNSTAQARLADLGQKATVFEQKLSELNASSLQIARSQMSESARSRELSDAMTDMEQNARNLNKYFQSSSQAIKQLSDAISQLSDATAQLTDEDNQNSDRLNESLEEAKASVRRIESNNAVMSENFQNQLRDISNSHMYVVQPNRNYDASSRVPPYSYGYAGAAGLPLGISHSFLPGFHFP